MYFNTKLCRQITEAVMETLIQVQRLRTIATQLKLRPDLQWEHENREHFLLYFEKRSRGNSLRIIHEK